MSFLFTSLCSADTHFLSSFIIVILKIEMNLLTACFVLAAVALVSSDECDIVQLRKQLLGGKIDLSKCKIRVRIKLSMIQVILFYT